MRFLFHSHKLGYELFSTNAPHSRLWSEIVESIESISEHEIVEHFEKIPEASRHKSISVAINDLLRDRLSERNWHTESKIFGEGEFQTKNWRLDFAKDDISVEVGFNHAGTVAWNLIKPVLASQISHVRKEIQTTAGVIVTATNALRSNGGFDPAIGTYESYVNYLRPLQPILNVPLVIVGLEAMESFHVEHINFPPSSAKRGRIVRHENF